MKRLMTALRHLHRCDYGSAAVEFSLVSLVLILAILGTIEIGRALNVRNQLAQAADFGTRKLLIDKLISDTALETSVRDAFREGSNALLSVTIGTETVNGVPCRTITLNYPFSSLLPGLTATPINLSLARRAPAG